jgi:hypothetical protein
MQSQQNARINHKMNLVIRLDETRAPGGTVFVHSTPIGRDVFNKYGTIIAATFARVWKDRLDTLGGPRVALLLLREVAEERGRLEDVEHGLLNEVWRLTNVVMRGEHGWESQPYYAARALLDEDDQAEVENAIVFFICFSAVPPRSQVSSLLAQMTLLWGSQTTPSSCTAFAASLTTLTAGSTTLPAPAEMARILAGDRAEDVVAARSKEAVSSGLLTTTEAATPPANGAYQVGAGATLQEAMQDPTKTWSPPH